MKKQKKPKRKQKRLMVLPRWAFIVGVIVLWFVMMGSEITVSYSSATVRESILNKVYDGVVFVAKAYKAVKL